MATSAIDPNNMLQTAADGTAATYLETITTLITVHNGVAGTDAMHAVQALVAPGAINPTIRNVTMNVDGTDAYTLADGNFLGDEIHIICIAQANTPVATVTPATRVAGYSNVTAIGAVGDCVSFRWTATGWFPFAMAGVTLTP
jgi:hypothetical protein